MTSVHAISSAFREGGWGMFLILLILVASVVIIVERARVLLRGGDTAGFMERLARLLRARDVAGAASLCERTDTPLTRIVGAGLCRSSAGEARVLAGMEEAARRELPRLEKRTGYLALLGNIATLAGLLGTIVGLIHSFAGVATTGGADRATLLARGISEAMNCTAFGLLVGVAALVAYSMLNGRTQRLLDEINQASLRAFRLWRGAVRGEREAVFEPRPIVAPAPRLTGHVGLRTGKHQAKRKPIFASLQLTPMIDMFIVVLIFLLMNFSGDVFLFVTKDVKLPFSQRVERLDRAPVVSISFPESDPAGGVVTLDGFEVSTAKEVRDDDGPDWRIERLMRQLEAKKHSWRVTHPDAQFPGEVIVQADRSVDFKIIKKVMYSCGLAGYSNVHFAVTRSGRASEG
jgi:biopolymer transport protein ExbB/TolQ/biopolymer transport protein ExbD